MTQKALELIRVAEHVAGLLGVSSFEVKSTSKVTSVIIHCPVIMLKRELIDILSFHKVSISTDGAEVSLTLWVNVDE